MNSSGEPRRTDRWKTKVTRSVPSQEVVTGERLDAMHLARPVGISAMSFFFVFGMAMSGLAALSLAFPGGVLEPMANQPPRALRARRVGQPASFLMATVSP